MVNNIVIVNSAYKICRQVEEADNFRHYEVMTMRISDCYQMENLGFVCDILFYLCIHEMIYYEESL